MSRMRTANRRAQANAADKRRDEHDLHGALDSFDRNQLNGTIYRLQSRNRTGLYTDRIRELCSELASRPDAVEMCEHCDRRIISLPPSVEAE